MSDTGYVLNKLISKFPDGLHAGHARESGVKLNKVF